MYSDSRGDRQKPPWTKPSRQKTQTKPLGQKPLRTKTNPYVKMWYFCGARPVLTPGATPMRSRGNSASTGFWILCISGLTVWDSIILSWPRFSPTSNTFHLWPWVVFTLSLSMGRPRTFKGRKPTSSSSSSSTGEFRNLLSVLYKLGFRFISKRKLLRKGIAVGSSRSDDFAVLDLSRASDEGVVKAGV